MHLLCWQLLELEQSRHELHALVPGGVIGYITVDDLGDILKFTTVEGALLNALDLGDYLSPVVPAVVVAGVH